MAKAVYSPHQHLKMKKTKKISSIIVFAALSLALIVFSSHKPGENTIESAQTPQKFAQVHSPKIPESIIFAGEQIDLTAQDRRERFDKEILSFTYSHINTMLIIKRANRLFPTVEPILKECEVPDDFKYLMIIESNGDPEALSPSKAAGPWQFLEQTGREYGLEVNTEVDERYCIEKATRAACKYLKDSYEKFGNWITVAASYNTGRTNVIRHQQRQKEQNAIDLVLPEETSRYIFRLMAVKTIFQCPSDYGFMLHSSDLYPAIPIARVATVYGKSISWPDYAKKHGLTFLQLREANHWMRSSTLTNKAGKRYKVNIPDKKTLHYDPSKTKVHSPNWVIE